MVCMRPGNISGAKISSFRWLVRYVWPKKKEPFFSHFDEKKIFFSLFCALWGMFKHIVCAKLSMYKHVWGMKNLFQDLEKLYFAKLGGRFYYRSFLQRSKNACFFLFFCIFLVCGWLEWPILAELKFGQHKWQVCAQKMFSEFKSTLCDS